MANFLLNLLSLSVSGSVLGLIVFALSRIGKKRLRAGFVYACWAVVLLRFMLPVGGPVGISFAKVSPQSTPVVRSNDGAALYVSPRTRTEGLLTRTDAIKMAESAAGTGENTAPLVESKPAASSGEPTKPVYRDPVFYLCLWAGGVLVSFGGTLLSFGRFRRLLFRTLKPAHPMDSSVLNALNASPYPALYRSDKVSSTVLLGLIRPVIILPDREYSAEDLDRILRHELTHYRRGDLAIKWLQTLVFSLHWFNPFVYLFRTQMTLYCELSCDERLLKTMDRDDKQSYGELLLALAADRALPRRVIAVSFTTQKRDLKERLVQIMTFHKLGRRALALSLAALIMVFGFAFVLGPAGGDTLAEQSAARDTPVEIETVRVTNADEFVAALGSNRHLLLAPGTYDLTTVKGYGVSLGADYYWEESGDGYTLLIDAENLTIEGEGGAEQVEIVTVPRSAEVLHFLGARNITLKNVTCGHTIQADACQGAVIALYGCRDVTIDGCVLFGCGTLGIQADECWNLKTVNTVIKECTTGAVEIGNCFEVMFDNCEFHDCKAHDDNPGLWMIEAYNTTRMGVYNTTVHDNYVYTFVFSSNTHALKMAGCRIYDNRFDCGFAAEGDNIALKGCEFKNNTLGTGWFGGRFGGNYDHVLDFDGGKLDAAALASMTKADYPVPTDNVYTAQKPAGKKLSDGRTEYHVSSVDEMLDCLGSDSVIYLEGELFELSAASKYGNEGGENYYWSQNYDGYGLVLVGIDNLHIVAAGEKALVELMPRSADVLALRYCSNVTLENLVLGHIRGAGGCTGDVVSFVGCEACTISNSELFGCGVNGVNAFGSTDIHVNDSEIYECSGFAAVISDCEGTEFNNVTIRDCTFNTIETQRCSVLFRGTSYYSDDYTPSHYEWDDEAAEVYDAYGNEVIIEEAMPAREGADN